MRNGFLWLTVLMTLALCSTASASTSVTTYTPWDANGSLLGSLKVERLNDSTDNGCGGNDWTAPILAGHTQSTVATGALKCLFAGQDAPSLVNAADPCWPNPARTMVACVDMPDGVAQVVRVASLPAVNTSRRQHPWALRVGRLTCVTEQATSGTRAPTKYACDDYRMRVLTGGRPGSITTWTELAGAPDRAGSSWTILRRKHRDVFRNRKMRKRARTARVAITNAWY